MIEFTLMSEAINSDDAGELARVLLNPDSYQPTEKEMRWWIDERIG